MDRCTCRRDITEILLETLLNTTQPCTVAQMLEFAFTVVVHIFGGQISYFQLSVPFEHLVTGRSTLLPCQLEVEKNDFFRGF